MRRLLHEESLALLEKLLKMLAKEGEDATFAYIRKLLRRERRRRLREKWERWRKCLGREQ